MDQGVVKTYDPITGAGIVVRDADRSEVTESGIMGDCVWVAADVTILRGVTIGDHSVIGTRSLVTRDIPPHTLAFGQPAEPRGKVGDRSHTR